MEIGLGQIMRLYYGQYQGDWQMRSKKDTVYLFKEETETNLSRQELTLICLSIDAFF